jgi:predicted Zn-dependent protease
MNQRKKMLAGLVAMLLLSGTVDAASFKEHPDQRDGSTEGRASSRSRSDSQLARVRAVMLPLLRVTDHRKRTDRIQISIVEDAAINAATAGDGRYFVTTGLLSQANDEQLRGVLAHEIAHEDLGHPAKAQGIVAGLSIGTALLERLIPGTGTIAPIAGTLISNNYTRPLELEADRHAVTLLERAGYPRHTMIDTLAWLRRASGNSGGGILSSHPAISERIEALRSFR